MQTGVTPELLAFILTLARYLLIAFGIMIAGGAVVYITMFRKGNFSGASIAKILQQTDVPKLATIILIVLAASLLGLLGVIAGEAVIALLSGIAGYVLGNRAAPLAPKEMESD
jgi:hypothetical protein